MNEQDFLNIIYAYATGSLDQEDMAEFLQVKKSGGLKLIELGELQNVISLLPVILELEKPAVKLKDKVARRLYKMQSEILARTDKNQNVKIPAPEIQDTEQEYIGEKQNNYFDEPLQIEISKPFINKEEIERYKTGDSEQYKTEEDEKAEPLLNENLFRELKEQESHGSKTLYQGTSPSYKEQQEKELDNYPQFLTDEEIVKPERKTSKLVITLIIFILLVVAGVGAGIYFYFSGELKKSNVRFTSLNEQIKSLDDEILRLNKSQQVLAIINSKDARTINLDGTVSNPNGFGKLILDTETNEGLLQLYNMPSLKNGQVYQLWLISKGQSFSMGNYKPQKKVEYLPVTQLPEISTGDIDSFKVTIEEGEGSDIPRGDVFLSTTMKSGSLK